MKRGFCCQPRSSTWDLERKSPTLTLLVSYLMTWGKHHHPPPLQPSEKCRCRQVCSPLQYRKGKQLIFKSTRERWFQYGHFFQPQQLYLKWDSTWVKRHTFRYSSLGMGSRDPVYVAQKLPGYHSRDEKGVVRKEMCLIPTNHQSPGGSEYSGKNRLIMRKRCIWILTSPYLVFDHEVHRSFGPAFFSSLKI